MASDRVDWVSIRGLPPMFLLSLGLTSFMFGFMAVFTLWIQSDGRPALPLGAILGLFGIGAAAGAFLLVHAWVRAPRAVGLSPFGVILRYPLQRVSLPWSELLDIRDVTPSVVIFRPLSGRANTANGVFDLTVSQARAILNDPRCPPVQMREDQRRLLIEPPEGDGFSRRDEEAGS
jgi:hypothetical protein